MEKYQEVLKFLAQALAPGAATDYRTEGGDQNQFVFVIRLPSGPEHCLAVRLERWAMDLLVPNELCPGEERLGSLMNDLEYQLEQSHGRNARVSRQTEGGNMRLRVEL